MCGPRLEKPVGRKGLPTPASCRSGENLPRTTRTNTRPNNRTRSVWFYPGRMGGRPEKGFCRIQMSKGRQKMGNFDQKICVFPSFPHCQQVKKKMCSFLALPRQKPRLHGRAVFLYPLRGYKNTTSRAFRCNSSAPVGLAGFPLQSLAPHGLIADLNLLTVIFSVWSVFSVFFRVR
jgi:hypothetical protein